ncbi:hypothetical protein BpHYR1_024617 [Brachionus plicatilis]|uniref:Uncharacterized protein n=1 Tax=Brachionus plicatilis TaxID=10195 RepID=A0A3M7SR53_BRAPC|nr:hypothetical protein BpHYR1_024617 [Brachionus plicatilis]
MGQRISVEQKKSSNQGLDFFIQIFFSRILKAFFFITRVGLSQLIFSSDSKSLLAQLDPFPSLSFSLWSKVPGDVTPSALTLSLSRFEPKGIFWHLSSLSGHVEIKSIYQIMSDVLKFNYVTESNS